MGFTFSTSGGSPGTDYVAKVNIVSIAAKVATTSFSFAVAVIPNVINQADRY